MIRKSAKAIGTIFYVPNDLEGRTFLRLMRKYLNRASHKIRVRGRNENRQQFRGQLYPMKMCNGYGTITWCNRHRKQLADSIPLSLASYFAVYIDTGASSRKRLAQEIKETRAHLDGLKLEVLQHEIAAARKLDEQLESLMLRLCQPRKIRV